MRRLAAACLLLLLTAGCARAPSVEVKAPRRTALRESFTEQAETRLSRTWTVRMPADGVVAHATLEPGDRVRAGQVLVAFDRAPERAEVARAAARVRELEAALAIRESDAAEEAERDRARAEQRQARAALVAARARVGEAGARLRQCAVDRARADALLAAAEISRKADEDAHLAEDVAASDGRSARAAVAAQRAAVAAAGDRVRAADEELRRRRQGRAVAAEQLDQARAELARVRHLAARAVIRSPIDGVVLERYHTGPGMLPAGERLFLLGRLADLEVMSEVLTEDAQRLRVGGRVTLQGAPELPPLAGRIRRIEPAGFTKLSTLGVEQKRVGVIIRFVRRPSGIGSGYRLQARFWLAERKGLAVPRFAVLSGTDGRPYVLVVRDGRLHRQPVRLGLREELRVEVTEGLSERDRVVAMPEASMTEGERVTAASPGP